MATKIDTKIRGITIIFKRFKNISPKNFIDIANSGKYIPVKTPKTIPKKVKFSILSSFFKAFLI